MDASRFGVATGAFLERDDWDAAVSRAAAEGWRAIELTAVTEDQFESLVRFLQERRGMLDAFERVSTHAPVKVLRATLPAVVKELLSVASEFDAVFHPDVYREEQSLKRLGRRVVFENMDNQKSFGRNIDDLGSVFDAFPDAGFCLDVAHAWTNDPSLGLADDLIGSFGPRLRQLHVSGIDEDGTHRPTTQADLDLYGPILARCGHVPWLLEAELAA